MTLKLNLLLFPLSLIMACTALGQENTAPAASRSSGLTSGAVTAGRKSYEAHCAMCHGLDGRGGEHAPSIVNSLPLQGGSEKSLRQIVRGGIPSAGMPSFSSLSENELVVLVKYVRSLNGASAGAIVKGDPGRGEELFFGKAQCDACHMLGGKGGFIGPDLSDFAVAHSPQEIRQAILSPNKDLLPQQQVTRIETVTGEILTGLVRDEDNFSLQLQGTDGAFHLLMKSQIAKVERTGRSLMPADYGTRLTSAELDDLVSFIARYGRRVESPPDDTGHRARRKHDL